MKLACARSIVILAVLACSNAALPAEILRCKDANGTTVVGTPNTVPDCVQKGGTAISPNGIPLGPAPPSPSINDKERIAELKLLEERKRDRERADARRIALLLKKYPDAAALRKAQDEELEPIRANQRDSKRRIDELLSLRKPLLNEAEFYPGQRFPLKLKLAFDDNDAQLEGQRSIAKLNSDDESKVIKKYSDLLEEMSPIWLAKAAR